MRLLLLVPLALIHATHAFDQNDPTLPTKSGVKTWVDVDTPVEHHTLTSSRGENWDLIMSDEFNLAGRNFTAGNDHLWVALDIPDGVNRAVGIYTPENALTTDGAFQIRIDSTETNVTFFNVWTEKPSWTTKTMYYRAAMVQTWNKFCIQGGFVEIAARMPGAIDKKSMNPHITGKRWEDSISRNVPVQPMDRIPDGRFYPTWPGLWMMGNLGRALFAASTNRMWPWTYNECDDRYKSSQRISACDPNPGYGLHPHMGRGSPEIDILEGGGTDISSSLQIAPGMPDEYRLFPALMKYESEKNLDAKGRRGVNHTSCYYNKNCLTPGANMADVPTSAFAARGHKSWYQGLRYAANNRCTPIEGMLQQYEPVAAAQKQPIDDNMFDIETLSSGRDLHADLSLVDGKGPLHWGINYNGTCFPIANGYKGGFLCDRDSQNPKCDEPRKDWQQPTKMMEPFEYQMDAISSNWPISYEAYTSFYKYQIEWVTGDNGYVRWMLDKAPIFEIPASALTTPPQGTPSNPKKIMIEEPSYFIFNVAMSAAWGATPPNVKIGGCRGNTTHPAPGTYEYTASNNVCDSFPMYMDIDYIRVWQDTKTMSYGCDPASHPTKEFIKAHISNYTDPKNPDIIVAGGASCNSNDDCTTAASVTGTCEKRRCKCADHWTGPRCTKYDLEATTYGPSVVLMGAMCGLAVLGSGAALLVRMRRNRAARQYHDEVNRRAKQNAVPSPSAESDVVRMQTA